MSDKHTAKKFNDFEPNIKVGNIGTPLINIGNVDQITLNLTQPFKLSLSEPSQIQVSQPFASTNVSTQESKSKNPFDNLEPNLEGLEPDEDKQTKEEAQVKQTVVKKTKSQLPFLTLRQKESSLFESSGFQNSLTSDKFNQLETENKKLTLLNQTLVKEIELLRSFIRINFKSPELLGKTNDNNTKLALKECFLEKPLVVLAYASPLVRIKQTDGLKEYVEMDLLDYQKEFQCAISGLKKTNNAIMVKRVQGTLERFQHILTDNPVGLHFSGHGIKNSLNTLGNDYYLNLNQGNCLVFEQSDGVAHYVSQEKLKEIVLASSLKFVFIATCHSQFAGQIFHNAGVEHVICVQQNVEIRDDAAIVFSQNFYELLFKETLTICGAFKKAKSMLESNPNPYLKAEASKFIILRRKKDGQKHECQILGPYPSGEVEDLTLKPKFSLDLARVEEFVGRQIDMQQVVHHVISNRFTTLKGIPGIGKTTVSKSIAHYLAEREVFQDGIIYISMRGHDQNSQLVSQLFLNFNSRIGGENFNDGLLRDQAKMEEKIMSSLKDKKVLIIIDNLENALRRDGVAVRDFLKNLLERLSDLKILSTSRDLINDLGEITEKVHELKHLSKNHTIQLLEKKSRRDFDSKEIKELFELRLSKQLEQAIAKPFAQKEIKKLEEHHLCELFAGHPMTVSLMAPLLQNSTLSQLYKKMLRMMSSKNLIQNLHELNPIDSLKVSTDASIQHVRSIQPQAIDLFCLFGLLPGGVTERDLNQLWHDKDDKDWYFLVDILKQYSLLVERVEGDLTKQKSKFMLSVPIMNIYAVSLLKPFELRQYQDLIVDFLTRLLNQVFNDLNVEGKRSQRNEQQKLRELLLEYEANIWACMYRVCFEDQRDVGDLKASRKFSRHRHHVVGYSSADEYESVLISEMTSDIGEDSTEDFAPSAVQHATLSQQDSSSANKLRSVTNSTDKTQEEGQRPEQIKSQQQSNQASNEAESSDVAILSSVDKSKKEGSVKKVRFYTNTADQLVSELQEEGSTTTHEVKNRLSESAWTKGLTDGGTNVIQEEFDDDDSSIQKFSDEGSSARGSITNSLGSQSLVDNNQRTLTRNKTEGDLHSQPQSLILQNEETSPARNDRVDTEPFQLPQNDMLSVNSQDSSERENGPFTVVSESQQEPVKVPVGVDVMQSDTLKKQSLNLLGLRSGASLSKVSNKIKLEAKSHKSQLEPIQEKIDYLAKDGLLLVIFVSILLLHSNIRDASRIIKMASKFSQQDMICRANLQKLQGLILFKEKKYYLAYQSFGFANKSFAKISVSKRQNIGIALCTSAQGYLLFNKTSDFTQKSQDDKQLYVNHDENQLYAKAAENFETALQIYKEVQHVAGQAFCLKNLGNLKRKMGMKSDHYFKEARKLQFQKVQLTKSGEWIERIDGEEMSLFIEIVGQDPKKNQNQVVRANQIKPETWIPHAAKVVKQRPSQHAQSILTDRKRYDSVGERNVEKAKDQVVVEIMSSDDENLKTKPSSQKATNEFLRKSKERLDGQKRKKAGLKPKNFQTSTKSIQDIYQPESMPVGVQMMKQLDYSWSYQAKEQNDLNEWKNYDFYQTYAIEQFYQYLISNTSQTKNAKLKLLSDSGSYSSREFLIMCDSDLAKNTNSLVTSLIQVDAQTGNQRPIARSQEPCLNPKFIQNPQKYLNEIWSSIKDLSTSQTQDQLQLLIEESSYYPNQDEHPLKVQFLQQKVDGGSMAQLGGINRTKIPQISSRFSKNNSTHQFGTQKSVHNYSSSSILEPNNFLQSLQEESKIETARTKNQKYANVPSRYMAPQQQQQILQQAEDTKDARQRQSIGSIFNAEKSVQNQVQKSKKTK